MKLSSAAALSFALLAAAGCHSIDPFLERCASASPADYVVVVPGARAESPCVQAFLARKRAAGLTVHVVPIDLTLGARERTTHVVRQLDAHRPAPGELAYVLFLATADELPMGPWNVEGLDTPVESDLPLLLGDLAPDTPIAEATWSQALTPEFPWVPGRIPFADDATLTAALDGGADHAPPLTAMLGAERFALWWDTSLVMSRARQRFVDRGWSAVTYAEDSPCDIELGESDEGALREQFRERGIGLPDGAPAPDAGLLFVAHWARTAPGVVYLNSHGSSLFITTVGDYLLSERKLDRLADVAAAWDTPPAPAHPAVVVIAACQAGGPGSELTSRLFRDGWARTLIASTENTHPTPLWAAIRAEIDTGAALASGLPVGLGMRAVRESYFDDARSSWSYCLFDSTAPEVAQNLLALTLYGDPSSR